MKLLCFDGNSVVNRAFYGIKLLTTRDGKYTNAVFGFMNIMLRAVSEYKPDAVAVAFDLPSPTFRHKMYDGYKATRKGMPRELAEQMPVLKSLLASLGYFQISAEGYEADDILGTFAGICARDGWECLIATGDRDSLQLIDANTRVILTTTKFGRGESAVMDEDAISREYSLSPLQLIELKALMGDSSDNVPGVAGIGEKTALALIQRFQSLDGVYENIGSAEIKEGVRRKLTEGRDKAYLSRKLVTIDRNAPINAALGDCVKGAGDPEEAVRILVSLEMHSLLEKLELTVSAKPAGSEHKEEKPVVARVSEFSEKDAGAEEVCLFIGKEDLLAETGGHVFRVPEELRGNLLSDEDAKKICVDAKRLHHYGADCGAEVKGISLDISLAAYLLNPSSPDYSAERLALDYGIRPLFEFEDEPSLGLMRLLAETLSRRLEETGMKTLHDEIELPLSGVLAEMERDGFLVDIDGIRRFGVMLNGDIEREREAVYALIGREFNINSPKQLGEALFVDLGLPSGKKTKSGFSTDAEVLERLRGYHEVIDHILKFRTCVKLHSTYVEGLLKAADGRDRVHTDFKQTETRTGRISSTNPNLQNIPVRTELGSSLRKFFVAKDGYVLLDADYSQIELRVLASISGDERMIEAFIEGRDIHTETASEVFKLPRNLVTPEFRRRAKAVNFGIVYGIGAYSLSRDVGVSVAEAGDYIDGYLRTYRGVKNYLDKTVEEASEKGYITTMFGRRRLLPELSNSNKSVQAFGRRLAMNTPIQGTAADIIKIAMIKVRNRLRDEGLDARLILQVHDELIVECTAADAPRAKCVLKEEMENAVKLAAPLRADVGEGGSWYDAK